MSVITMSNLSPKFRPFLIGSPTCTANVKDEIDLIFQRPLTPLKSDYIFDAGKWVLKLARTDGLNTTPDTHLYRIRKAEKIRTYIQQNNLETHITVPRKYLYWNAQKNQFYVVSEKMNLSSEVASPASVEINDAFKNAASFIKGQVQALADNAPKRSLTPTQTKALAELSILGYTDLSYNNLYFTHEGKVAIIDTEPQKRSLKKGATSSFVFFLLGDKQSLLSQQAITGMAKLKLYTDNPTALQAIQKVETNHVLWSIAQLIAKIALVTLAIYFIPTITAFIPIAALATVIKNCFTAIAVLKNVGLILQIFSVSELWRQSYRGLQGIIQITDMEVKGAF